MTQGLQASLIIAPQKQVLQVELQEACSEEGDDDYDVSATAKFITNKNLGNRVMSITDGGSIKLVERQQSASQACKVELILMLQHNH